MSAWTRPSKSVLGPRSAERFSKRPWNDCRPNGSSGRSSARLPARQALALLEAIETEKADLIAVGFRGTSGTMLDLMLGSVSRAIAHSAKVPALVVKSGPVTDEPAKQSPGPATKQMHVLTTYDAPEYAERAARLLKELTWPKETRGWIMTVVRPMFLATMPDWVKRQRDPDVAAMASAWEAEHQQNLQSARNELEQFRATLPGCFANGEPIVAEGRAPEKILAEVREKGIDLVVMGSRGRGSLQRLLLGSTSEQVLREAPCSVLIVR